MKSTPRRARKFSLEDKVLSGVAVNCFKSNLTKFEQTEIINYKNVYYTGDLKVKSDIFTNDSLYYNAIINDHIAYKFQILEKLG